MICPSSPGEGLFIIEYAGCRVSERKGRSFKLNIRMEWFGWQKKY